MYLVLDHHKKRFHGMNKVGGCSVHKSTFRGVIERHLKFLTKDLSEYSEDTNEEVLKPYLNVAIAIGVQISELFRQFLSEKKGGTKIGTS